MTKRLSALAISVAVAGGFLVTSVPAQAATAGHVVSKASITCNERQMRQQIADLKVKAAKLKQLGEDAAAKKALNDAAALQHKLDLCIKADRDASKPFPG